MCIPKTTPPIKLGGYELMVANDVMRARFRNSFERPEPLVPNQVTPITVDLHAQSHQFLKGAQGDGPGAKHLVPHHRSQSANLGAEYLRSQGKRFRSSDPTHLAHRHESFAGGDANRGALIAHATSSRQYFSASCSSTRSRLECLRMDGVELISVRQRFIVAITAHYDHCPDRSA